MSWNDTAVRLFHENQARIKAALEGPRQLAKRAQEEQREVGAKRRMLDALLDGRLRGVQLAASSRSDAERDRDLCEVEDDLAGAAVTSSLDACRVAAASVSEELAARESRSLRRFRRGELPKVKHRPMKWGPVIGHGQILVAVARVAARRRAEAKRRRLKAAGPTPTDAAALISKVGKTTIVCEGDLINVACGCGVRPVATGCDTARCLRCCGALSTTGEEPKDRVGSKRAARVMDTIQATLDAARAKTTGPKHPSAWGVGLTVATVPPDCRSDWLTKEAVNGHRRALSLIVKKITGATWSSITPHPLGDEKDAYRNGEADGETFHPHLNVFWGWDRPGFPMLKAASLVAIRGAWGMHVGMEPPDWLPERNELSLSGRIPASLRQASPATWWRAYRHGRPGTGMALGKVLKERALEVVAAACRAAAAARTDKEALTLPGLPTLHHQFVKASEAGKLAHRTSYVTRPFVGWGEVWAPKWVQWYGEPVRLSAAGIEPEPTCCPKCKQRFRIIFDPMTTAAPSTAPPGSLH